MTFTTAPTVAVGDRITSTERNAWAAAFNDRLRSGFDCTWRLWWYVWNLTRNMVNPEGDAFPESDIFLANYLHVTAASGQGVIPGHPVANVSNPLMAFIYGREASNIFDETTRMDFGVTSNSNAPGVVWALAKEQRQFATDAAKEHRKIYDLAIAARDWQAGINRNPLGYVYLQSWGGITPTPNITGECHVNGQQSAWDFTLNFTSLKAGTPNATFGGQCADGTDEFAAGNVSNLEFMSDRYRVTQYSGTVTDLLYRDYIIGPYTGGEVIQHNVGAQMEEALHWFVSTFKGTDADRANDDKFRIQNIAFDWQRFFETQYLLAEGVAYPVFSANGLNIGDNLPVNGGPDIEYAIDQTAQLAVGVLIVAGGTTGSYSFSLQNNGAEFRRVTVEPNSQKIVWLRDSNDAYDDPAIVSVKALSVIPANETVTLEFAILTRRKPDVTDAYVMARKGSTTGAFGLPDNTGHDKSLKAFSENYFNLGCISHTDNLPAQAFASDNPIYETARATIRERMRFFKRASLRGYAVENGKSVLWFARHVTIDGEQFDAWDGIVGAIATTAPEKGLSNEWLMFLTTNVSNESESSPWKPANYGDVSTFLHNRAHFYHGPEWGLNAPDLAMAATPGQEFPISVESPSSFNYYRNLNANYAFHDDDRRKFFKSCPLYKKDYEVESCEADGDGEVKVTFTTRFQVADGAPESDFGRTVGEWDIVALHGEEWRTDENAIREYLANAPSNKIGDGAEMLNPATIGASGSVNPRFYFTRLITKVHEDNNTTQEKTDTRCFASEIAWGAFALRSMCESFEDLNGASSQTCPLPRAICYTFENLCYQASSGTARWINLMPTTTRSDGEQGFGAVPNTRIYADAFNLVSKCLNKLTRVTVELPWEVESRQRNFYGHTPIGVTFQDPKPFPTGDGFGLGPPIRGSAFVVNPAGEGSGEIIDASTEWANGFDRFAVLVAGTSYQDGGRTYEGGIEFVRPNRVVFPNTKALLSYRIGELRLKDDQPSLEALPEEFRDEVTTNLAISGNLTRRDTWLVENPNGALVASTATAQWAEMRYDVFTEEATDCVIITGEDGIFSMRPFMEGLSPTSIKRPVNDSLWWIFNANNSETEWGTPEMAIAFEFQNQPRSHLNISLS